MPTKPTKPTAPSPALRSQGRALFSANMEACLTFVTTGDLLTYIDESNDFIDETLTEAQANLAASIIGDAISPSEAGKLFRINGTGDGVVFVDGNGLASIAGLTTSEGDIVYTTALDTYAALNIGTAGQVLTVNDAGTGPEWGLPVPLSRASTTTLSNDATVDFTLSGATLHEFRFFNVIPSLDNALALARVSDDGGSSFETGGSYYSTFASRNYNDGADLTDRAYWQTSEFGLGSAGGEHGLSGIFRVYNPTKADRKTAFDFHGVGVSTSGQPTPLLAGGETNTAAAHDAIRFYMSTGDLESGIIEHWEIG